MQEGRRSARGGERKENSAISDACCYADHRELNEEKRREREKEREKEGGWRERGERGMERENPVLHSQVMLIDKTL